MIPPLLDALLRAPGPSGQEVAAARAWRDWCAQRGAEVGIDNVGSAWARLPASRITPGRPTAPEPQGERRRRTVAVAGHIDQIGLHVTHIEDGGFLRFGQVGGWDPLVLVGQRVVLEGTNGPVLGVIARKPIHLLEDEERKQVPQIKDLHIDIGASSAEQARERVRIGDMAVLEGAPVELQDGLVVSPGLDNRGGCYVAARALELVVEQGGAGVDLLALAVAQEETSLAGSRTSAFAHDPDLVIVIDMGFETQQPGVSLGELTAHPFGSGPSIARGSSLHPGLFELLHEVAVSHEIPFTLASYGRVTGTDADAFNLARAGIATALLEIPSRYMHTPVEMVSAADLEACAQLIAAFAVGLESDFTLQR